MKKTFNIILIGLISLGACAQGNSVLVEYKVTTAKKMDEEKFKKLAPEIQAVVKAQVAKLGAEDKTLVINGTASRYYTAQEIEDMGSSTPGIKVITMKSGASSEEIYKNTANNQQIKQAVISDKKFLIEAPLTKITWSISSKTKTLGNYTVQEAKAVVQGQEITAWFAKAIALNQGPDIYWGLPGLILEVETPNKHIIAEKVIPVAKASAVDYPKQGKKISQDDFNKLSEQKKKQLLDMYQNNGGQ